MYDISFSNQFKKDYKRCIKRNYNISLLEVVLKTLRENGKLPPKYKPHILSGDYDGFWECHIKADWLMTWLQDDTKKEIYLDRLGTHSDLF
ncbi:type II toxin-antitoxin system YafQ family toxin [Pedobacter alluvionis]|uniref:Type II toxin-antitoxin system YafQ family toxin n=1 Tax=Pedobacter alluvionis TaxID=475253 RepID=A0A497XZW6_9SPHI|nr:type II toxin-antitoxin system YafQ family toxin [Pedobacter alluvionis]RLJ72686.1 mRNA interferase YafQ [Pedobacter alluvionis]TFB29469.1 type II toxin-antitoxin system YafQ family toxin [Pedobacter alluvionis]